MIGEDIKPSGDPWWKKKSGTLMTFLRTPRTWDEILAWGKDHKHDGNVTRNIIAWLETQGQVSWDGERWWKKPEALQ